MTRTNRVRPRSLTVAALRIHLEYRPPHSRTRGKKAYFFVSAILYKL
jgi:hypothetical protein